MSRYIYTDVIQDGSGNALSSATITIYLAGTTTKATIYTAVSGGTADADSILLTDTAGTFTFYVDEDDYPHSQRFKFTAAKTGYSTQTKDYLQIFPDAQRSLLTDSTVDQGAAATVGTLAWHIADLSGSSAVIKVYSGTYLISTDVTVPITATLELERGVVFSVDSTKTLTVYSPNHLSVDCIQTIKSGSGTMTWTVGGKVPVCWYGAVGDGSTDDVEEIQEAADNLIAGSTLFFPKTSSYYKMSTAIDVDTVDDIEILFSENAEVRMSAANVDGFSITKDRITIRNATMEGFGTYVTDSYNTGKKLIRSTGDYTTVEGCYLKEPENVGILVSGSYAKILNNRIEGGDYFADTAAIGSDRQHIGIMAESTADHLEIKNNVIIANSDANAGKPIEGIYVESGGAFDADISHNKIYAVWDHAIYANVENSTISYNMCRMGGIKVRQPANGTVVSGNSIIGNNIDVDGIGTPLSGDYGINLGNAAYSTISGNTIVRPSVAGIAFSGSDDPYRVEGNVVSSNTIYEVRGGTCYGIGIDDANLTAFRHNVISDNIIYDVGDDTAGIGISVDDITDNSSHVTNIINGNIISQTRKEGIYIQRFIGGNINDNHIYNTGISSASAGISLVDVRNFDVKDNRITGVSAQLSYGVTEDADCRRNMIEDNAIINAQTGAYTAQQTSYVQGNHVDTSTGNGEVKVYSTSGNRTLGADEIAYRMHLRDPNGAARTDTTDTAVNIVAWLLPYDGAYHEILYVNTGEAAETITIAAGTGVVLYNNEGSGDLVISAVCSAKLVFVRISSTVVHVFGTVFEAV